MNFQDAMDYRNFPSFYPKDHDFSHSDRIFNSVSEEQEISSVKCRLHASTEKRRGATEQYLNTQKQVSEFIVLYEKTHNNLNEKFLRKPRGLGRPGLTSTTLGFSITMLPAVQICWEMSTASSWR